MEFMLGIDIKSTVPAITYNDNIFIIGSCFTEHIGGRLAQLKFPVLQNPGGILFDPLSICNSLVSYVKNEPFEPEKLCYINELWHSWEHHSSMSGMEKEQVVQKINTSQQEAHNFLKQSNWLIITPGTSFSYQLAKTGQGVANCHRAPAQWFNKHMLSIEETVDAFDSCLKSLFDFNKDLKIVFTVSPVRHIRDGVILNNRSKARLLEAVHFLSDRSERIFYFPSYELVIDVLRDYRFYDTDMVHPNYAATEYVFDKFSKYYIDASSITMMEEIKSIITAYKHKPFQPFTQAHGHFLKTYLEKVLQFQQKNPHLSFEDEIRYFSGA